MHLYVHEAGHECIDHVKTSACRKAIALGQNIEVTVQAFVAVQNRFVHNLFMAHQRYEAILDCSILRS